MLSCPACGEQMFAHEEWTLREGLAVGEPAEEGDYVHERCADYTTESDRNG